MTVKMKRYEFITELLTASFLLISASCRLLALNI
jgi:hypothetical protein